MQRQTAAPNGAAVYILKAASPFGRLARHQAACSRVTSASITVCPWARATEMR
jgi:hypothetical protein